MFQGGFVGNEGYIEISNNSLVDFKKLCDLQNIEDNNNLQILFSCDELTNNTVCRFIKITFTSSTDFYGRITVYKLDVEGR